VILEMIVVGCFGGSFLLVVLMVLLLNMAGDFPLCFDLFDDDLITFSCWLVRF